MISYMRGQKKNVFTRLSQLFQQASPPQTSPLSSEQIPFYIQAAFGEMGSVAQPPFPTPVICEKFVEPWVRLKEVWFARRSVCVCVCAGNACKSPLARQSEIMWMDKVQCPSDPVFQGPTTTWRRCFARHYMMWSKRERGKWHNKRLSVYVQGETSAGACFTLPGSWGHTLGNAFRF